MLEVRLLGRFEIRHGKKAVDLTSRPAQSLFGFLILNAGTAYRREKLAGQLWPESTEESARDYLRHALWRIRKALQSISASSCLQANDLTISFNAAAEYQLDAAALQEADEAGPIDKLAGVLSEYTGELLPGFYDEWVVLERERLQAVYERKASRLLELLQSAGQWQEVLEWAEKWIALGQKPEVAYRYLMSAYAAEGDMAKAAAAYERCVKSLAEYGVEPSEETRSLYEDLKAGKRSAKAQPKPTEPKQTARASWNVPGPLTSFIGREKEIADIVLLLQGHRLVTLTGPGGVGKTRLAIQVANKIRSTFKNGVCWVELAPLADPKLVPQAIAGSLEVRESLGQSLTEAVTNYLASKQLLLILDNSEHLILASAEIAQSLVGACPQLKILTTSREALDIPGEVVHDVPVLSVPKPERVTIVHLLLEYPSIRLFVDRAQAVKPDFELTEGNAAAVYQICHQLDGIPLALELAAARVRSMPLDAMVSRLDDRFRLLTGGSRSALPRQQTLRATIDWSYALLSEQEKLFLQRLSVFRGGWTLAAAEAVCSEQGIDEADILDLLANLVNKSLVSLDESGRYQMLETVRQYAGEKLMESAQGEGTRDRHLDFMLGLAESAHTQIHRPDESAWFDRLRPEIENLRAALEHGLSAGSPQKVLALSGSLYWFWWVRGYVREAVSWLTKALERPEASYSTTERANALTALAWIRGAFGEFDSARALFEESIRISRVLGDKQALADALSSWCQHISFEGYAAARPILDEALAVSRELGYKVGMAKSLIGHGEVDVLRGNDEAAQASYEECAALLRELGDRNFLAYTARRLGHVALRQARYREAIQLFAESLQLNMHQKDLHGIAACLAAFGSIATGQGNAARAAQLYGAAEAILESFGGKMIPMDVFENQPHSLSARTALSDAPFEKAHSEGLSMNMEQAIAFALEEIPEPSQSLSTRSRRED